MIRAIMTLLFLALTWPCIAANINPGSTRFNFNFQTDQSRPQQVASEDMLQFREACIQKAEYGEQLALKKMHGKPLRDVLSAIAVTYTDKDGHTSRLPNYIVVEMKRLARDAYRLKYREPADLDEFVLDLYHNCLYNGW